MTMSRTACLEAPPSGSLSQEGVEMDVEVVLFDAAFNATLRIS